MNDFKRTILSRYFLDWSRNKYKKERNMRQTNNIFHYPASGIYYQYINIYNYEYIVIFLFGTNGFQMQPNVKFVFQKYNHHL